MPENTLKNNQNMVSSLCAVSLLERFACIETLLEALGVHNKLLLQELA
jgi:hypothetical protein